MWREANDVELMMWLNGYIVDARMRETEHGLEILDASPR